MNAVRDHYDVVIVGGGSGGVGACLAVADAAPNARVLLAERDAALGGTSTLGGVNNWEPGVSTGRYHVEIARRLLARGAACVAKTTHFPTRETPVLFSQACGEAYDATRRVSGLIACEFRRFQFEPRAMCEVLSELLAERPNVEVALNAETVSARVEGRNIAAVRVRSGAGEREVSARVFIDATADASLSRMAGCACALGCEAADEYGEPGAPKSPDPSLNAATLIFRVTDRPARGVDEPPAPYDAIDVSEWVRERVETGRVVSFVTRYPNGDDCFNMLPTMQGRACFELGAARAYAVCAARAYRYFAWLQREKGFDGRRIASLAPRLGVREGYRLKARWVLREQDAVAPFGQQARWRESIACADHLIDVHGDSGRSKHLAHPYGVPYACLLPREIDNLLVASRGAGFTHIVAASCRLSRTVMALGEAAGFAAAQCLERDALPPDVDVSALRAAIGMDEIEADIRRRWGL